MDEGTESSARIDDRRLSARQLSLALLFGATVVVLAAWLLAGQPHLPAQWQADPGGQVRLVGAESQALHAHRAQALVGLRGADAELVVLDELILQRSPRWLVADEDRERHAAMHAAAAQAFAAPTAGLVFADGASVEAPMQRRGLAGLGTAFWLFTGLGLLLYMAVVALLLAQWSTRNLLFAVMSLCQLGNLAFAATESVAGLGLPILLRTLDMPARLAFDLVTAAAAVHAVALLYPRSRAIAARRLAAGAWCGAFLVIALGAADLLPHLWWWAQLGVAGLCGLAIVMLHRAERDEPHPQARQLRRIGTIGLVTWLAMTLALAVAWRVPSVAHPMTDAVSTTWYVFLSALLLLVPVFLRARPILREFALLAATSTTALSIDLIFMSLFSLGPFAALVLSLFVSLALYAGARQWILDQLFGSTRVSTERMFDRLYRIAREVQSHPRRVPALLLQFLRDLFEPLEAEPLQGPAPSRARVEDEGATLVVPIAALAGERELAPDALRLRFAQRGRRVFTREDARLADRIVEQLGRAVAFDHAVEQGRREERLRLAQDLHDDIGARLLTLMYKAPSPEIEEYVRHTLKDLKTLTRGLAASGHKLGDAAAEWKADLTQRLTAADIVLGWGFSADRELMLSVVQWSALTRILRELVSNAIAHARATRVDVAIELAGNTLSLSVADDGAGVDDPQSWSHGLGLGGIRKRVKQLGGEVDWRRAAPGGIECFVRILLRPVPD